MKMKSEGLRTSPFIASAQGAAAIGSSRIGTVVPFFPVSRPLLVSLPVRNDFDNPVWPILE
jgi:hypothetical protein